MTYKLQGWTQYLREVGAFSEVMLLLFGIE